MLPMAAPPDAQAALKSLLTRARSLIVARLELEKELIDACSVLAKGAGAFDEELKVVPDNGHGAEKACAIAAAKANKILKDAKDAKVSIVLDLDPPRCFTAIDDMKKCLADCGSPVTKGDDRALCTGGEVYGTCKGRCSGACANDPGPVSGVCWGVCTGKCDKEFRGFCGGKCNGTCNGNATHGPHRCIGICDGACADKADGICSGRCDGACSSLSEPRDLAKCNGICTGQCAGEAGPAVCSGDVNPPGKEGICMATCTAGAAVTVRCNAPLVRATVKGGKQSVELQKLLTGLQAALPRILRVQDGTSKKLPRAMDLVSAAAIDWSNAYATAGPKPLSCVRAAIDGMKDGAAAIDTSVSGSQALKPLIQPLLKPTEPPPGPPPEQ
jgi:hypothetical protein